MTSQDDFEGVDDALVDAYLLFLRGRGPEPDLTSLAPEPRARATKAFALISALADRDVQLPPLEEDRVAARLGLFEAEAIASSEDRFSGRGALESDEVARTVIADLEFRFGEWLDVDWHPLWQTALPVGLRAAAQGTTLGETMAVCIGDVPRWIDDPAPLASFLLHHHDITSVGIVSSDGQIAAVLRPAETMRAVVPTQGWVTPVGTSAPEPPDLALGRQFEQSIPRWDRVATLDELTALGDIREEAEEICAEAIAEARQAKPRLPHKKQAMALLSRIDAKSLAALIVEVQASDISPEAAVARVASMSGEVGT